MTGAASLSSLARLLAAFPGGEVVEGANLGTAAVAYAPVCCDLWAKNEPGQPRPKCNR